MEIASYYSLLAFLFWLIIALGLSPYHSRFMYSVGVFPYQHLSAVWGVTVFADGSELLSGFQCRLYITIDISISLTPGCLIESL